MRHPFHASLLAVTLVVGAVGPSSAFPSCAEGQRKIDEASALRFQVRQDVRIGDRDRVCDTLDEIGDRYADARDAFEDCGAGVTAIDLRSESRALITAKAVNRCD